MPDNNCPICGTKTKYVFRAGILNKYDVSYLECPACGLLQTEKPYWLEEAYDNAVSDADTGILARNIQIKRHLAAFLYVLDRGRGQYLDAAGGFGILVRLMRDIGFDFYWHDPFCKNIFATMAMRKEGAKYSVVSAVEVLEHIHTPVEFLSELISEYGADAICITTELRPEDSLPDNSWWYYSYETGQHVSFYSEKTLRIIAEKIGMIYMQFGVFHVFIKEEKLNFLFRITGNRFCRSLLYISACRRLSSFTNEDRRHALESGKS
jgi:hypothetical protein